MWCLNTITVPFLMWWWHERVGDGDCASFGLWFIFFEDVYLSYLCWDYVSQFLLIYISYYIWSFMTGWYMLHARNGQGLFYIFVSYWTVVSKNLMDGSDWIIWTWLSLDLWLQICLAYLQNVILSLYGWYKIMLFFLGKINYYLIF